jgi:sigma-E factor negative regulatory protein RseC
MLTRVLLLRSRRFVVQDSIGVNVGDEVVVAVEDGALYRSSLVVYALALAGILGGAIGAAWLMPAAGDGVAALGAALGLASAFPLVRRLASATPLARAAGPRVVRARGRAAVSFHS